MLSLFHVQAADLLAHPHLRPCIMSLQLDANHPRRQTLPATRSDANRVKKTRYHQPEGVKAEKKLTFGNNRALNPSISGNESQLAQKSFSNLKDEFSEPSVACVGEDGEVRKVGTTKLSTAVKTPRVTSAKPSTTSGRQLTPSRISNHGSTLELVRIHQIQSFYILQYIPLP